MRPLDRLPSIKLKLGVAIVIAVGVSATVSYVGFELGLAIWARPLVAVVIALAMVQVLARGMTSPLREMADASHAMAKGDYERRVTATSADEVGDLARAFNSMAAQLAEVDRQRRDLIANVSHELRTPLSALRAQLENVVDGVGVADPATLETMLRQVDRLGRLVAQLLDLSRLEAGTTPLDREQILVGDVIEDAVAELRLATPSAKVDVSVSPPDLEVFADSERLHQVVLNLLENAVRHSPPEAPVGVSARRAGGSVCIEVSDEGEGIGDGDASRIFDRFYRADAARSSASGGAGLGLSIAQWIADLHGGDIRVEPSLPRGSRFVFTLPTSEEDK